MSKTPKGIKGMRRKLRTQKEITHLEIKRAMHEASQALDRQTQELQALKRIIISERAQVIYYTEKYRSFVARECVELVAKGFLDLSEEEQTKFISLAIKELEGDAAIVPHDADAVKSQVEAKDLGKKIILQ